MEIDFQKLLTIARVTEGILPEQFQMETVMQQHGVSCIGTCGTVGCMIGHSASAIIADGLPHDVWWSVEAELRITDVQGEFLFGVRHYRGYRGRRDGELPTASAARVRKFVYFKLKQAELHEAWNERQHRRGMECVGHPVEYALAELA